MLNQGIVLGNQPNKTNTLTVSDIHITFYNNFNHLLFIDSFYLFMLISMTVGLGMAQWSPGEDYSTNNLNCIEADIHTYS